MPRARRESSDASHVSLPTPVVHDVRPNVARQRPHTRRQVGPVISTWSHPCRRATSTFASDHTVPITVAPSAFAH